MAPLRRDASTALPEAKGIYNKSLAELDRINIAVQLGTAPVVAQVFSPFL